MTRIAYPLFISIVVTLALCVLGCSQQQATEMKAKGGDSEAQFLLGLSIVAEGGGSARSYTEAAQWFRKAADQGHAEAQGSLGALYGLGKGVEQDDTEAAKWFGRAAGQNQMEAQFNLGLMYAMGDGVPQDYVIAYMWLRLAREQNHQKAERALVGLANRMTGEQIAEAQKMARAWQEKSQSSEGE